MRSDVESRLLRRCEDQHAVGDLGPHGTDETPCVGIRSRSPWWDLDRGDAGVGEGAVERGGELSGAVPDQEPELGCAVPEVHEKVTDLLGGPPAAVPSKNGARSDQPVPPKPSRHESDQRGEHGPVRPVPPRPRSSMAQHRDLHADSQSIASAQVTAPADFWHPAGQIPPPVQGLRIPDCHRRERHLPRDEHDPAPPPHRRATLTLLRHPLVGRILELDGPPISAAGRTAEPDPLRRSGCALQAWTGWCAGMT